MAKVGRALIHRNRFARKIGDELDFRTSYDNGNQGRQSDIVRRICQSRNRRPLRDLGRSCHLLLRTFALGGDSPTVDCAVVAKSGRVLPFGSSCVLAEIGLTDVFPCAV